MNILFVHLLKFIPRNWAVALTKRTKSPRVARLMVLQSTVQRLAEQLVSQKYQAALNGKGSHDVMSLMGMANAFR